MKPAVSSVPTSTTLLCALALVVGGCSTAPDPSTAATGQGLNLASSPAPYPTAFAAELLGPLSLFPACDVDVTVNPEAAAVVGLTLPPGAVPVLLDDAGALTQVQGYVPLTPVQVLDAYVRRDDLHVVSAEHEQFESEVLFEVTLARSGSTDVRRRVYLKAQAVCATGSNFNALVSDVG